MCVSPGFQSQPDGEDIYKCHHPQQGVGASPGRATGPLHDGPCRWAPAVSRCRRGDGPCATRWSQGTTAFVQET